MGETISAFHDELALAITDLINLAGPIMMKREAKEKGRSTRDTELPIDEINDELIEDIKEEFLNGVFGDNSHLTR